MKNLSRFLYNDGKTPMFPNHQGFKELEMLLELSRKRDNSLAGLDRFDYSNA